ncbi:hypothetical protein HKBW3S42_00690 [Candidatus Hakubella thermalkaliphila]|uniref:Uncharacterized protein n=1 Tax=Candidatus Hakubella thermalkaliphila TaxID=2754717 RepID=A0A6V8PI59_9ACTN|nr:hypothetical protein [Candidatus Hakubella thermalkaliphila]GFP26863.1 hypothetical protein HKBW3S33_00277 [Candidatus Hakubella thermalkaliphila]GFP32385.1 hypothetical protein HKBW3S42_00690 [Candidatus Hakubella thermalkaliphila]GFP43009.1 hypothetical protein HKBW3C_02141 [Candidatus Hakubella thermalkaliphila]
MITLFEVINRALSGPFCSEKDFDLKILVPELRRVIKSITLNMIRKTLSPPMTI